MSRAQRKPEPEVDPDVPVFGDPDWIKRRGPAAVPKRPLKGKRDPKWRRFQPIWQRIEGRWRRFRCCRCAGVSFRILDQEGAFVHVRCSRNHRNTVLAGFQVERPE